MRRTQLAAVVLIGILTVVANACLAKKSAQALSDPSSANNVPAPIREYVDLEPGWRLRIIAAVTKSGSDAVKMEAIETKGHGITLKVSDDLIGYETAYWSVMPRLFGGVSIKMTSAELTRNGQPEAIATPSKAKISVPNYARFIRIFYLTRKSDADHNMALAGVGRIDQFEALTKAFRESPNETCISRPRERIYCDWIPVGVAVRPEVPKKSATGETHWADRF